MKHLVVFSHGFGVRKDDRGLLTDIADGLGWGIVPVMFDYNEVDEANNTLIVRPLSQQAEILKSKLQEAQSANPDLPTVIVGHSQGCVVAALANPEVDKAIMLAPSPSLNIERLAENFSDRPGTVVNLEGESKLTRRDGSSTIIGPEYVRELQATDPKPLYNQLAEHTKLVMVRADEDEILGKVSYDGINAKVIGIKANHDFTGPVRAELIELIKKELAND